MNTRAIAARAASRSLEGSAAGVRRSRRPRHALRAWPEIARGLRAGGPRALFLDFDGTLVNIRRRPEDVRCAPRVRGVLARLARRPDLWIGIVSGRRSRALARLVGVPGLHYCGVFGAEREGVRFGISAAARRALSSIRGVLSRQLRGIPGVWMESKGASLAVHYRSARQPAVLAAESSLRRALAPVSRFLRVIAGRKTWEIVPREIPGKGAAVLAVMRSLPEKTVGIYIGDDAADEEAFSALPGGITIRVGRAANSAARYFLRNPAEVWRWLVRFEEALQ